MVGELEPDPARMRISDDDRHQVAEILREAAGEGRLDRDELDQRLEATYAARTYADLVPITHDLPVQTSPPQPARRPSPVVPGPTAERQGTGIMGGYSGPGSRVPAEVDDRSPTVRVRGVAIWGGVSVERKR